MFTKTAINLMNSTRVGAQTGQTGRRAQSHFQTDLLTYIFPTLATLTHFPVQRTEQLLLFSSRSTSIYLSLQIIPAFV